MQLPKKIRNARSRLFNTTNLKIFGFNILEFDIQMLKAPEDMEKDFQKYLTAYVFMLNGKPQMRIYEPFIEENNESEMTFIMLHEIMHVLEHHVRVKSHTIDHTIANIAQDHVINNMLSKDVKNGHIKGVEVPEKVIIIEKLKNKNMSWYEVYQWLLENSTTKKYNFTIGCNCGNQGNQGQGQSQNESQDKGNDAQSDQKEDQNGQGGQCTCGNGQEITVTVTEIDTQGNGNPKDIQRIVHISDYQPDNSQEAKDISDSMKLKQRSMIEMQKNKGDQSGEFYNHIKKIVIPDIPWTEVLGRAILSRSQIQMETRSWKQVNKFAYGSMNTLLPGPDLDDKPGILILGRDTSGSISDKELKKFAGIAVKSISHFDELHIIDHDVKIQKYEIVKVEEAGIETIASSFKGRGGTSHKYIFDKIEELWKKQEELGLVMLLTDYISDIEQIWNNYQWHKFVPLLIVCTYEVSIPEHIDPKPIYILDEK